MTVDFFHFFSFTLIWTLESDFSPTVVWIRSEILILFGLNWVWIYQSRVWTEWWEPCSEMMKLLDVTEYSDNFDLEIGGLLSLLEFFNIKFSGQLLVSVFASFEGQLSHRYSNSCIENCWLLYFYSMLCSSSLSVNKPQHICLERNFYSRIKRNMLLLWNSLDLV